MFGIEEIGVEIENPFGDDDNDLPLEQICETIGRNVAGRYPAISEAQGSALSGEDVGRGTLA